MDKDNVWAIARVVALTLAALLIWAVSKYDYAKPAVLDATAPASEFSAGRADATLGRLLGPEIPHSVSSDENARVRARLIGEFAKLGVQTSTYRAFTCNSWRGFGQIPCATVTDVLAEVVPGPDQNNGKAIVLLAHYDSVPAGPGASDDESGVAIVLEVARALKARGGQSKHPVLAVITDGEEAGLLGAQAFLQNPALKARVGVVVNVEARGTRGRSLLFQTSPKSSALIGLYADAAPYRATSSLFAEIYKLLPNDTDLTLFIKQGFPSFNFAFSDNVADYHTPYDRRENLSKLTLQQQGENMLRVASALQQTDYAALDGHEEVYLDIFGRWLPRMPASWALPLSVVVLIVLAVAAFRARGISTREWVMAGLLPPAMILAGGLIGWVLSVVAQLISGQPDPSYAYPIALREALAFGVLLAVLVVARMTTPVAARHAVWLWYAVLAVVTSLLVPGFSPYFLFPALVAAAGTLIGLFVPRLAPLADLGVLLALPIWLGLVAAGEGLMGLKLHPLFTVPAAFAAMTLVPLLDARAMPRLAWRTLTVVALGGALVASVIAGMQPAFSKTVAQRLSIRYVEGVGTPKWALDGTAPLPAPLRAAASFASDPTPLLPGPFGAVYQAPAGSAPRFTVPPAEIVADGAFEGGRRVTVALHGSSQASAMGVLIPKEARVRSIAIHGQNLVAPKDFDGDTFLACASRDCAGEVVAIETASHAAFALTVIEQRYGLPDFAHAIVAARPPQAIPSQSGDSVVLVKTLKVPAR